MMGQSMMTHIKKAERAPQVRESTRRTGILCRCRRAIGRLFRMLSTVGVNSPFALTTRSSSNDLSAETVSRGEILAN
jgi:hypothetical protein